MTVNNTQVQSASPQAGLLARHPLISFFVMAFAFSWKRLAASVGVDLLREEPLVLLVHQRRAEHEVSRSPVAG